MSAERVPKCAARLFLGVCLGGLLLTSTASVGEIPAKQQLASISDSEFRRVQERARHGDAGAQASLAVAYEEGIHVPQDLAQALYWYRRAAEQGSAEVQHHLGLIYEQGRGTTRNFAEAAAWYAKAAEQGYAPAQCNLGTLYLEGRGV